MSEEDRTVGKTVEGHSGKLTGRMKVGTVPDQKEGCGTVQKQHYWNRTVCAFGAKDLTSEGQDPQKRHPDSWGL